MMNQGWALIKADITKFLSDRLHHFLAVRSSFGIGDDLGLGSLPRLHFPNTWMKVIPLVKPDRFFAHSPPRRISLDAEEAVIIVEPLDYLLSVYPRPTSVGSGRRDDFERRFLSVPDEALVGGYAHECAAYLIYRRIVPKKFKRVLKDVVDRQKMEDALAAAQGYRDEVLCFLETHLKLLVYEAKPRYGWFFRGSLSIRDELEDRIAFLKNPRIDA